MTSIKGNAGKTGMLPAVVGGTAAAGIICGIAVLIGPIFILNEYMELRSVQVTAIILQAIGVLVGSLIVGYLVGDKNWMAVSASAGLFYAAMICVGMLFFEADASNYIMGLVSCGTGAVCALLLLNRGKKTQKRKRTKHSSR